MRQDEYLDEDYMMKQAAEEIGFSFEENARLLGEADRIEKTPAEEVATDDDLS